MPVVQENVLGLNVAMHDILAMGIVECPRDRRRDGDRVTERKLRLPFEPAPERLALDVGHDVEEDIADRAGIEQRDDVRVLEVGRDSDLLQEPRRAQHGHQLGAHDLHCDVPVVLHVPSQIDRRHRAVPKLAPDHVTISERSADAINRTAGRVGHQAR